MAPRPRLVEPAPTELSPERRALAEAIRRHEAAVTNLHALVTAVEWSGPAAKAVRAAEAAIEAAEASVKQATDDAAERLLDPDAARGLTVAEARSELAAAIDSLAVAQAARETLRARIEPAKQQVQMADFTLEAAAQAVLRAEASQRATAIGREVVRLQTELMVAGRAMEFLISKKILPVSDQIGHMFGRPLDTEIRYAATRFSGLPQRWDDLAAGTPDGAAPWRVALAGLLSDASTPLPE